MAFIPGELTSFPIPNVTRILNPGQGAETQSPWAAKQEEWWQCSPMVSAGSKAEGLGFSLGSSH